MQTDNEIAMRRFYTVANAIRSRVKFASNMTVFLMETFCLPLLSYACEALNYNTNRQQLNQLNVCWNRTYRKAFHTNDWESVKQITESFVWTVRFCAYLGSTQVHFFCLSLQS